MQLFDTQTNTLDLIMTLLKPNGFKIGRVCLSAITKNVSHFFANNAIGMIDTIVAYFIVMCHVIKLILLWWPLMSVITCIKPNITMENPEIMQCGFQNVMLFVGLYISPV